MNAIRKILVIVDPTAAHQPAVVKGSLLAEKLSAKLELFTCDGTAPLHTALMNHAKHTGADLIVKDTHHHTFARRTVFTNTDWELIRGLSVSLLLTKATSWSRLPKMLAAIDPGHENDEAASLDHCILDRAAQLAQRLDGKLHVVHAYLPRIAMVAPIMAGPPLAASVAPEVAAVERAAKLKTLIELTTAYSVPRANIHLEVGGVRSSICGVASEVRADVVVMGAVSRNGLTRAFIGSTAEEVLERLPCDALIVKS